MCYSLWYNAPTILPASGRSDPSPPSSAVVKEEYSYNSTHPLDHNRICNGITYTLPFSLEPLKAQSEQYRVFQKWYPLKTLIQPCSHGFSPRL